MPGNPRIRASDADRDRTAALLREHHAAGRLTAEEFSDRMEKAMDAVTIAELNGLMEDLPAIDLYQLPAASLRRADPHAAQSLVPRDPDGGPLERLPPGATAAVAWVAGAAVLLVVGLVAAVVAGALVAWAFAAIPVAVIAWIWFFIRRSGR